MTTPDPEFTTALSLYRRRWYVVPDDVLGGWAIATVDRPVSRILLNADERVLFDAVFEDHARWVVDAHNRAVVPWQHFCDRRDATGAPGECHLEGTHLGRCDACERYAPDCDHQPGWETVLLCPNGNCTIHR